MLLVDDAVGGITNLAPDLLSPKNLHLSCGDSLIWLTDDMSGHLLAPSDLVS